MEELIKRSTVIDVLKQTGIIQDNELGHLVVDEIERIEATTEADIKAKAISVMGMAMKELYPSCKGAYVDFDVFFYAVMAKVAE